MGVLDGKVAIVTGGARGIGLAIARRYLAEGAKVVIADIDQAGEAAGARARRRTAASSRPTSARRTMRTTSLRMRAPRSASLDVLVNNAGIIHAADFLDLAEQDFDRVLRVNLKGAFLVGQAAARQMVAQVKAGRAGGAIVNMSSINAAVAIPNQTPYCVSKGGLSQLTKVMALSLAPHGIRVNAIGPGSIMTPMMATIATDKEAKRRVLSRTPLGRIGDADEVASVAAFLASDDASYVTGEIIYVDGGRLALNYTVRPGGARPESLSQPRSVCELRVKRGH